MSQRRDGLYGRRKGKPLSPYRAALMAETLPRLLVDTNTSAPTNLASLFERTPSAVRLEIGFGGGEHLITRARAEPEAGFIGVEPFVNGMAKAVAAVVENNLANVRLFGGEASVLLDWLPPASLASIDVLYPDPWPKKRHWKRRFVSGENLDRIAHGLKPEGVLRVASDIPDYVTWTLALIQKRDDLAWTAERASDWTEPFPDWPGTRYEAKALAAGRIPTYLTFRRTESCSPS